MNINTKSPSHNQRFPTVSGEMVDSAAVIIRGVSSNSDGKSVEANSNA